MNDDKQVLLSAQQKAQKLKANIEKAKIALKRFQEQRTVAVSKMLSKYGLEFMDDEMLENEFKQMAERLNHGNKR